MAPPPPTHMAMHGQQSHLAMRFPGNPHMVQGGQTYGNPYQLNPQQLHQHPQQMVFGAGRGRGRGHPQSHSAPSYQIGGQAGSVQHQSGGQGRGYGTASPNQQVGNRGEGSNVHHHQQQHTDRQKKQDSSTSTSAQPDKQVSDVVVKKEPPDSSHSVTIEMTGSSQTPPANVKKEPGVPEQPVLKLRPPPEYKPVAVKVEKQGDASNKDKLGHEKGKNDPEDQSKQTDQQSDNQTSRQAQTKTNQLPTPTKNSDTSSKNSPSDAVEKMEDSRSESESAHGSGGAVPVEGEAMDTEEDKEHSIRRPPVADLDKDKGSANTTASTSDKEQDITTSEDASDDPGSAKDTTKQRLPSSTEADQSGDPADVTPDSSDRGTEDKSQPPGRTYASVTAGSTDSPSSDSSGTAKKTLLETAGMQTSGKSDTSSTTKGISKSKFYGSNRNSSEDGVVLMQTSAQPYSEHDDSGSDDNDENAAADDDGGNNDGEGGRFHRKPDEAEEFIPGKSRRRNRNKRAKTQTPSSQTSSAGSYGTGRTTSGVTPPGLLVSSGSSMDVHFHTIIPPDFDYNPTKDKVVVRIGKYQFGFFEYDCLEMHPVRELPGRYTLLAGCRAMNPDTLKKDRYNYKYYMIKSGGGKSAYEYIHIQKYGIWDRCLDVPIKQCRNRGVWHQYDDTMQLEKSKEGLMQKVSTKISSFFFGSTPDKDEPSFQVSQLVRDRQLAVLTYLPRWEGFVTDGNIENIDPGDALLRVEQVHLCAARPKVMATYGYETWVPEGFDWKQILVRFLASRLATFSSGSDADNTGLLGIENRLVSALAITFLVNKYDLPLTNVQWGNLLDGLQFPTHLNKNECNQLVNSISKVYSGQNKDLILSLKHVCKSPQLQTASNENKYNWLLILPILHFYRKECLPCTDVVMTMDYNKIKWWGVEDLGVDKIRDISDKEADMLQSILEQLAPLFDVDRLLPRSFLWLKMTPKGLQQVLQAQQFPADLLCCALDTLLSSMITLEKEHIEDLKLLCEQVNKMVKDASDTPVLMTKCVQLANLASRLSKTAFKKAWKIEYHTLVSSSCELFVACYNLCLLNAPRQTRSQQNSLMANVERSADHLQKEVLDWLNKRLSYYLSHDTKGATLKEELDIWHSLLSISYTETTVTDSWNKALYTLLEKRVKSLHAEYKLDIFGGIEVTQYHGDIGKVFSEAAFEALHYLLNDKASHGVVSRIKEKIKERISGGSDSNKYCTLFSDVLLKSWPKSNRGQMNEMQLLRHVLVWTPFVDFFKIAADGDTGLSQILSEEAKMQLDVAKTIFLSISDAIQDGTVLVGQLKLLFEGRHLQQFLDLYKIMGSVKHGSNVDQKPMTATEKKTQVDTKAILRLLNTRKKELEALQYQINLNKTLVSVLSAIPQVDYAVVAQKLRTNVQELQLHKVCKPITMQQLEQQGQGVQPNITFFSHPVEVQSALQQLYNIQECRIFKRLLKAQASTVRENRATITLSVFEVFTHVFNPVYSNQLVQILVKLRSQTITLGEVDYHFGDIKDRPQTLRNELRMLSNLRPDQGHAWVAGRLAQIQDYYRVQHQAEAAGELLKIKTAFDLKGNFKPMETLNDVNLPSFKQRQLKAINQEVIQAAEVLQDVGEKEVECLRQLAQCKTLINWVRQEIKDIQELKVFVDLAMISAGETDMEVDRVSCFHRAATGYAPFIFELKDKAGYSELLRMTQKVWKALENDHHLPKKLRDTQRQLFWLKEVKDSQGSVETSSLSQAEAINAGGVYTVGNLHEKGNSTATLKLKVTMREMTVDEDEEDEERVYTLEKLRDLQSRLTLVAGKTQEDRQGLQSHVEDFVEVFTAAQQLASTYSKLCSAGCILFKEWTAILFCGKDLGDVSVHVDFGATQLLSGTRPLMMELNFLRKFMDNCLNEWHRYVDEQRSRCYDLNYFTTEQLVLLRQHLAQYTNTRDLHAQIYVLLSSVKQMCNKADIEGAIKAAMRQVAREAAPAPMEAEEVDSQSPEATEAERLNEKKTIAKKLMDDFLFDERMALASVEAVGLEHDNDDYVEWCIEHEDDTELIQELISGLQAHGLGDDMMDEGVAVEEMDEEDSGQPEEEEMFESFPTMNKTMKEVTQGLLKDINRGSLDTQLKQLWENHLHSMKSMDVEDCLSLEHLGLILHHLTEANPRQPARQFPPYLKTGQPNLIVRSTGDVWTTVLSLYMFGKGRLPTQEEVLICSPSTTVEQVLLLWRRALSDRLDRVFCLVRADLLDYDVSVKAEQQLHNLMQGKAGYHLVILCSSEREDSSHIVTALDQYRVEIPGVQPLPDIQQYLRDELTQQARTATGTGVHPAAMITPHNCTVEVIVSSRPGVGKTLAIQRYAEKLRKHLGRKAGEHVWVTVPLQTAQVEQDTVVSALLPHQQASYTTLPQIFHIDVAPMVREGLDHLLFNLLILGGLCNSHGKAWKRKPQDLYVVEITDFTLQHRHTRRSPKGTALPFYGLLPSVTCRAPQEVLRALQQEADWPQSDPQVDKQEFESQAYQRTFQYLARQHTNLDMFNFDGNAEGNTRQFLETLLSNCGVVDPSWSELRHFAHFLSIQLNDCQQSTFCIPALLADTGLQGFKSFVVRFMVQMAKDFATPSLNMSEESPSRAILMGNGGGNGNGRQAEIPELAAFQLRRRWESSFHPYIFFNHDRQSMTFMGFVIDQNGSLIDPIRRQIIDQNLMTPQLRAGLHHQRVNLSTDFDQLDRMHKLMSLCMVLGVEDAIDPDDTYELTTDNVKKMLAIHMRFRCGIPVVIMGETGCGKTRLIRFLCRLQAGWRSREGLNNMILMKVHGGTTASDIQKKIKRAENIATRNKKNYNIDTVLFFDEANTTEAIGLIKEIMCDGRAHGQHINMANGALKIVAACNPYRRHSEAMIQRLKKAGLGYHVSAENTQERLGCIPLRELVYRVQALPPSMLPLVWDFGQLGTDVETKYIRQIVQRYVRPNQLADDQQATVITTVLAASHDFMRAQKNECSFVSLRDVERCLEVMVWFYEHMELLEPLMDRQRAQEKGRKRRLTRQQDEEDDEDDDDELLDDLTMSLVLALGVCYHACLQKGRAGYRQAISRVFTEPCTLPGGAQQMQEEISRCQDVFLAALQLGPNIARNSALKENVFMMVVCIELRIPLFLVGKPGSSKSLAKTIVADAMQGDAAHSRLFKNLKQVHMISFQCSPLSTPDGIVGTFRQCSRFQEGKDLNRFVSVVVLDEVGLAEDSPRMPLKTLHPLLETGSEEDEDNPAPHKKVGFVGLSNWALDPAKMNRGILVSREEPDEKELVETARGICATDNDVLELIEPLIPSLAKAYLSLYKKQKREFFGLRDYYSLIKMVYSFSSRSGRSPTQLEIEHSVRRNFGGLLGAADPMRDFEQHMQMAALAEPTPEDPDCSPAGLLQASLQGHATGEGENRYLLVLTENYAALPILRQQLLSQQDAIIIFGSSFPYDQEYTQVCRNINRIKVCMETGRTVVLLNLENLYESLYDALNQYYVYFGGQRYVDLGLGTHRVKCRVHKDFRLIVIADKDVVYERFPTPLINRLEKHFLATSTMLTSYQREVVSKLERWVQNFASIDLPAYKRDNNYKFATSDAFVGYHDDTLASLVYQVCCEMGQHECEEESQVQDWKDMVCNHVKALLLQCATPEAVCRLNNSKLRNEADDLYRQYMEEQQHSSLAEYLRQQLGGRAPGGDGHQQEILYQVTTHSRLLVKEDRTNLAHELGLPSHCVQGLFLQKFQTEQQFSAEIREFFSRRREEEGLLLVQCEDGHQNNQLTACASYCIQDERTQAKQVASEAGVQLKPAHVVFVIQLSRMGKGFTGFQGGTWHSIHIDDLRPPQANRPEISHLRGQGVHSLLQQDLQAMGIQTGNEGELEMDVEAKEALIGEENLETMETTGDEAARKDDDIENGMEEVEEIVADVQEESMDTAAPRPRAVEVAPCDQTRQSDRGVENNRVAALPPVDLTRLLQESLHAAASRIGDSDERTHRTTERIILLQQYLQHGVGQGTQTFLSAIKQRVTALTGEWEERRGTREAWLNNEAIAVAKVQESGTFRRSIWQHLVSIVTPLLAEVLAFCDYNDNLSLLSAYPEGHWQHQLWLAILVDPNLSPIHYEDFLSPKNLVLREKALVKVLGSGERHFSARLSFSWLLKNHLEIAHTTARELKANTEQTTVYEVFSNHIIESPWGRLLNQIVPAEASQQFLEAYMMDYVCMMYTAKSDVELECVCQALQITSQVLMRQSGQGSNLIQSLVALHMAHTQTQARLSHFARLVEVYPDLVDPKNIPRLANQDGEMTLDAKAIHVTVDSLQPTNAECREQQDQHRWLRKVQVARPVIETVMEAILHDNTGLYGPTVQKIVQNTKLMWDKISVLRLFIENVSPPNADVEKQISQQGLLLWKGQRNVSSMKNIDGLNHLEKILNICNKSASKLHFKYGFEDCPICKMAIQEPVELPCHHVCCKNCIRQLFNIANQRKCPTCRVEIAKEFKPVVTKQNKAALDKFHAFRQRCNAFFMDVVSQLCFADGTAPSHDVVIKLLSYVTRKAESDEDDEGGLQTKMLTAFQGDCIDRTPVIRSVLLQLLLQSSVDEVRAYMSQYLEQAQQVLVNSPAHEILDVCTLFIHCIEDAFYRKASSQANPSLGLLQSAIHELHQAAAWLRMKAPGEGLTVQYLQAIAGARFGLVVTAQFLFELYCESNRKQDREIEREVRNLLDEARTFCSEDANHQAHLFLVRQLCRCYGTNTMETLSQHAQLRWVKPRELRTANAQVPDRFLVCGGAYRDIREALAEFMMTEQFNGVTAAVRDCQKSPEQRQSALLLALYREVTLSHCTQGDQEEAPPEIKQQLLTYIQSSPAIKSKELASCLVNNRLGPMLSAAPGQPVLHQTLASIVAHTFTTLSSAPNHHLLRPLINLMGSPAQMQTSYLPTMPEDYRMEARQAIAARETVQWYECPNGHPYTIGDCGRPNQASTCRDCGLPIGGGNHQLATGGRNIHTTMRDTTTAGHVLGDARNRGTRAVPDRNLTAISMSILRAILHATMMAATIHNQNAIQQMIHPALAPTVNLGEFLLQHLLIDLNHLAAASGKSQDDCLFIIHIVLHRITTSRAQDGSGGATWPNKQSRMEWETQFSRTFISPVIENLDQRLATANESLRNDQRFSANPLMRLLHQPVVTGGVTRHNLHQLHSLPAIWQHRPRINVESLQQHLTQSLQQGSRGQQDERPLALLQAFLEQENILRVLRHLPDIIRLQQMLIDKFHRRIDGAEATSMSIQDFLDNLPLGHYQNQLQLLIGVFIETWNQVREHIPNYGGLTVPRELCIHVMSESSSLAMLLPTRREAGVCSTALVDFLISKHNGFIETYHSVQPGLPRATVINPCDASIGHLVAYHHERDLLPMILSHCDYAMEAGNQGTTLTYNLYGLQRQIKERFVQGRPKLVQKIEHLVFRQDSRDATIFQALRTRIPQESLSPPIRHQILSELRSFPDLCDCLAALDIAIGFLVNTTSEPAMRIREYLHQMLKLPIDRGLRPSPKAQQHCRLHHILSLWQALAVERARRLLDNNQDPFEGVRKDFRQPISREQVYQLGQSLRHLNVEHLVAELYEYIVLNLKKASNQEQDMSKWSISAVLSAYLDEKDGHPIHEIERLSDELQLQHAVSVWQYAVGYMQQHQARANGVHH